MIRPATYTLVSAASTDIHRGLSSAYPNSLSITVFNTEVIVPVVNMVLPLIPRPSPIIHPGASQQPVQLHRSRAMDIGPREGTIDTCASLLNVVDMHAAGEKTVLSTAGRWICQSCPERNKWLPLPLTARRENQGLKLGRAAN
jgi:hypothetical protein